MKRLFFALLPDAKTRQHCVDIQHKLAPGSGQPVLASNLHVTLLFLGQVDAEKEQALIEAATKLPMPKLQLSFDQLTYWQKPKILCLTGQNTCDDDLNNLVLQLTKIAVQLALPVDERPYIAHVTLARKAQQAVAMDFEPFEWPAQRFCLMESCSLPTGVEYRVCRYWEQMTEQVYL